MRGLSLFLKMKQKFWKIGANITVEDSIPLKIRNQGFHRSEVGKFMQQHLSEEVDGQVHPLTGYS